MKVAPIPTNEASRLSNLLSYGILDSGKEKHFDDLAELIAHVCDCRFALISFIDKDRQWFKSTRQIGINETPRDISFCAHTILQDEVMIVKNTKLDKRFFDSPFVSEGYKIGFYAGAPIISSAGYKIGTVCALDKKPKYIFSGKQKKALKIIASQVTILIEVGVKDKWFAEQTEAITEEAKKDAQRTMNGHEVENHFIANELHENFAQTLAATNLYLGFAEQSKESSSHFIKKGKTFITQIIHDIKALSKSMLPDNFEQTNYIAFIQDMLNEYGIQNNKKISFKHEGNLNCYTSQIGLSLFRIIQYQLKNAGLCKAKKIGIKIITGKNIRLQITDDGKKPEATETARKNFLHHIETRTNILNGTLNIGFDSEGNNLVAIEIPLTNKS
jgi:glucose-6-phosphate-specific signal transduction histidine kinase